MRPWLKTVLPETFMKKHFSDVKINYNGNEISIATKGVAGFTEFLIRKAAHVIAFALFSGFLLFALWNTTKQSKLRLIFYTLLISFLFACTDELHQKYTGGRSAQFTDVWIDFVGAVMGILVLLIFRIVKRKRNS